MLENFFHEDYVKKNIISKIFFAEPGPWFWESWEFVIMTEDSTRSGLKGKYESDKVGNFKLWPKTSFYRDVTQQLIYEKWPQTQTSVLCCSQRHTISFQNLACFYTFPRKTSKEHTNSFITWLVLERISIPNLARQHRDHQSMQERWKKRRATNKILNSVSPENSFLWWAKSKSLTNRKAHQSRPSKSCGHLHIRLHDANFCVGHKCETHLFTQLCPSGKHLRSKERH